MAIATDVFPNPGEPQIDTIRADPEVRWLTMSSHTFWRPVKCGTNSGRRGIVLDGFDPFETQKKITINHEEYLHRKR